jgi:iron(III) transport system ATP-binding protein
VEHDGDGAQVEIAGQRIPARLRGAKAGNLRVLLRPEALTIAETGLAATVASTTYRGPVHETRLRLDSGEEVILDHPLGLAVGDRTYIAVNDAWVIPGS